MTACVNSMRTSTQYLSCLSCSDWALRNPTGLLSFNFLWPKCAPPSRPSSRCCASPIIDARPYVKRTKRQGVEEENKLVQITQCRTKRKNVRSVEVGLPKSRTFFCALRCVSLFEDPTTLPLARHSASKGDLLFLGECGAKREPGERAPLAR